MTSISTLTSGSYLGLVTTKGAVTGAIFSALNMYLNGLSTSDPALMRGFLGSMTSSVIADILTDSIVKRLVSLSSSNVGVTRIYDQALSAAISGGLNVMIYDKIIRDAPNNESATFEDGKDFAIQIVADVAGSVLTNFYLAPLLGFNQVAIDAVYQ